MTRHRYGDCDACGDPAPLLEELHDQATRLGIDIEATPHNSYDITISTTGPALLRLLAHLTTIPTEAAIDPDTLNQLGARWITGYIP